jgi:hypothetical protein
MPLFFSPSLVRRIMLGRERLNDLPNDYDREDSALAQSQKIHRPSFENIVCNTRSGS